MDFLVELDSRIESLAVTRAQLLKNASRHLHPRQLALLEATEDSVILKEEVSRA